MPRQNEAVNEIWICDKGRFAYHFTEDTGRLGKPLVKVGKKQEVSKWDGAVEQAAKKLRSAKGDAVILAGGRLSNEDLFNLKQLADGLGGEALLYTPMGGGALTAQVGVSAGTNFKDMGAGTTILVAASDLYNEAPIWYLRIKQAARRGATLIVAGGRATKLEKYAKFVVRYAYGDEAATVSGLAKKAKVGEAISTAENLVVLYGSDGLGLEGSSVLASACANLLVETKHVNKANNGLIGVWPRANDQGAWELGFKAEPDLAKALKGKTVYVVAADPAGDDPALAQALKEAKFVIVQELFPTATARLADVVLPAQAFTEREGSFTSGERRVQRFYPAVRPLPETRPDFAITAQLAKAAGVELEGRSPLLVMERLAAETPAFAGISYRKLAEVSEQWPIVGRGDLYYGGTTYENSQGLGVQLALAALEPVRAPRAKAALRPKENQWLAVPVTRLYDRGVTVATSGLLAARIGELTVTLHPDGAKKLGLDGTAEVRLNGTAAKARVVVDENVPASVVLLPRSMGFPIHTPAVAELKKA
jgi:NADH-quinone oxidoreductase subunit G